MRLIDAEALYEIAKNIWDHADSEDFEKEIFIAIATAPTIEERKWIPCSERLPEENVPVLLGVKFKDDFKYFVTARMDYNYWTGLGRDIRGEMRWRRLPEPWKGEE